MYVRKEESDYESESDHETAQSKRLRLAKEYIKQLENEGMYITKYNNMTNIFLSSEIFAKYRENTQTKENILYKK